MFWILIPIAIVWLVAVLFVVGLCRAAAAADAQQARHALQRARRAKVVDLAHIRAIERTGARSGAAAAVHRMRIARPRRRGVATPQ